MYFKIYSCDGTAEISVAITHMSHDSSENDFNMFSRKLVNVLLIKFDTFCDSVRDLLCVFDLAGLCLLRTYLLPPGVQSLIVKRKLVLKLFLNNSFYLYFFTK